MTMLLLIVSKINLVHLLRNHLGVDVNFWFVNICTFRNQSTFLPILVLNVVLHLPFYTSEVDAGFCEEGCIMHGKQAVFQSHK